MLGQSYVTFVCVCVWGGGGGGGGSKYYITLVLTSTMIQDTRLYLTNFGPSKEKECGKLKALDLALRL